MGQGISGRGMALAALVGLICAPFAQAEPFLAGLEPWQRPDQAPVILEYPKPPGWYDGALRGVEAPFPASLRFLEDQGGWHQPFIRPGMPGPYDIRNWHQK